jgi:hypothetical protein
MPLSKQLTDFELIEEHFNQNIDSNLLLGVNASASGVRGGGKARVKN